MLSGIETNVNLFAFVFTSIFFAQSFKIYLFGWLPMFVIT